MEDKRETKVKVMNLTKQFDQLLVLDDISFDVKKRRIPLYCRAYRLWQDNIF